MGIGVGKAWEREELDHFSHEVKYKKYIYKASFFSFIFPFLSIID